MVPGTHLGKRLHGLSVHRVINSCKKDLDHAGLVSIEDEFLVAHGQSAFKPSGGMEHEIDAGEHRALEGIGRFVCGLRVREFGGTQAPSAAKGHPQTAGQCGADKNHHTRFRRSESGGPRLHRHGA